MAIWHKEISASIESVVDNADIVALHRRWTAQRAACGGVPPAEEFQVADTLADIAPNLMLLQAVGDDFLYHHYGADIMRHSQFDMTGRMVSEFGGEIGEFFAERYRRVRASGQPLYTVHFSDRAKSVLTWERLILPLKDNASGDWMLVYNRPLESRHQLLEAVLNAASDAILAVRAQRDESGAHSGWLILVANAAFAQIAGAAVEDLVGRIVQQVLPRWDEFGLEADCHAAMRQARGQQRDIEVLLDGALRWFSAYTGPLGDGCVVRLADITAVKQTEMALRNSALRLQSDNAQLQQMALLDGLTGLANRRAFDAYIEREISHARRSGEPLALAMCDIDYFKAYNDTYGHLAGDDAIRAVAQVLSTACTRAVDLVARYGGEEFVVVMPHTTKEGALIVLQRAQQALRQRAIAHAASPSERLLTLSFGVAQFAPDSDGTASALIGHADAALFRAKQAGRNRIAA